MQGRLDGELVNDTGATAGRFGARDWARFVVPSAAGILTFLVPISVGGLSMESEGRSRVVHQVSFWDGLVIAAAKRSGCRILCSEDLQARATFEGADLLNPFAG